MRDALRQVKAKPFHSVVLESVVRVRRDKNPAAPRLQSGRLAGDRISLSVTAS
jgi:hypothetical protein